MNSLEVIPENICFAGGDICVYDSTDTRIVTAYGGQWGEPLIHNEELGKFR